LELTDAAKELLFTEGYDPNFGARPLKRAIQKLVQDPLAQKFWTARCCTGITWWWTRMEKTGKMTLRSVSGWRESGGAGEEVSAAGSCRAALGWTGEAPSPHEATVELRSTWTAEGGCPYGKPGRTNASAPTWFVVEL